MHDTHRPTQQNFECRLITYSENETPPPPPTYCTCLYVCLCFLCVCVCGCNYHYLLNQQRSEGNTDILEEWREGGTDRRRNIQSWPGERNDQNLNEGIPAGGILEGERSKHQQCTTTEEKERKTEVVYSNSDM